LKTLRNQTLLLANYPFASIQTEYQDF